MVVAATQAPEYPRKTRSTPLMMVGTGLVHGDFGEARGMECAGVGQLGGSWLFIHLRMGERPVEACEWGLENVTLR
jgi:hypothetical protein